jgi:hypothetical protein
LLLRVVFQDLIHLVTFRVPNVTWDTWRYTYFAARRLRDGVLTQDELEMVIRRMFVRRRHRKRHPERRARLPILRGMSLEGQGSPKRLISPPRQEQQAQRDASA